MKRNTKIALVLWLAVFGAVEARADCQFGEHVLRGSISETVVYSQNDPFSRLVGIVTGTLNGASTVYIITLSPPTSFDVFVTIQGDMLTAIGSPVRTPIPGKPGEFTVHVDLKITGGSGRYAGATGWMTFDGHSRAGGPGEGTADVIYKGCVSGPNINGGN
jgi:hypothetical protein